MRDINQIFEKIQEQKREQREIAKVVRETLELSKEYADIKESMEKLRSKKLKLEDAARGDLDQKLDLLKLNIKDGLQTMSDVAVSTFMRGESVKLVDSENNEYEPIFSVKFQKTTNRVYEKEEKTSAK